MYTCSKSICQWVFAHMKLFFENSRDKYGLFSFSGGGGGWDFSVLVLCIMYWSIAACVCYTCGFIVMPEFWTKALYSNSVTIY